MQIGEILKQYQADKTLLDIYRSIDLDETLTAYIHQVSDHLVCIIKIDDDGEFDGQIIVELETILRIRHNTRELNLLKSLMEQKTYRKLAQLDMSSMENAMKSLNQHYGYINSHKEDEDTCFIGELINTGEYFQIHEYATITRLERPFMWLRTEDITRVEAGGKYEENLKHIYTDIQN